MASSTDHTIKPIARIGITRFLEAHVTITSPANNANVGQTFTVTGTASCEAFRDDGAEIISEGDSTQSITAIDVRLGGDTNPFQRATATGPGAKPWQSWSFAVNTAVQGTLSITARVTAARSGYTSDTATATRQVMTDATPPTLTINTPADINKPTPPYTATIAGAASDAGTGIAAVEWRLGSSGSFQAATGTTSWSAYGGPAGTGHPHREPARARQCRQCERHEERHGQRHRYDASGAEHHHAPGGRDLYAGSEQRDRRGQRHGVGYPDRRRPGGMGPGRPDPVYARHPEGGQRLVDLECADPHHHGGESHHYRPRQR